jgi:hypothetical protein
MGKVYRWRSAHGARGSDQSSRRAIRRTVLARGARGGGAEPSQHLPSLRCGSELPGVRDFRRFRNVSSGDLKSSVPTRRAKVLFKRPLNASVLAFAADGNPISARPLAVRRLEADAARTSAYATEATTQRQQLRAAGCGSSRESRLESRLRAELPAPRSSPNQTQAHLDAAWRIGLGGDGRKGGAGGAEAGRGEGHAIGNVETLETDLQKRALA